MVDIKLIHYDDGIIIECVDDMNARALVPNSYLDNINKQYWVKSYRKSPLTIIMRRLENDFNYCNLGQYKYHYFINEKGLNYNFHRKIIE